MQHDIDIQAKNDFEDSDSGSEDEESLKCLYFCKKKFGIEKIKDANLSDFEIYKLKLENEKLRQENVQQRLELVDLRQDLEYLQQSIEEHLPMISQLEIDNVKLNDQLQG